MYKREKMGMSEKILKKLIVILTILVTVSVLIAGTMLAMPVLKRNNVEVAKEQTEGVKRSYATEETDSNVTEDTGEITRNYEIKEEETWDVSEKQDGSVIAKWTLSNKTLTISGSGNMKDWNLNNQSDWHNTQYTNNIENVTLGEGILSIGKYAFYNCINLKKIEISGTITNIRWAAFYRCSSLKSVEIPSSVTIIESCAFEGCSSLENIKIPSSVTSIDYRTFDGCVSLTNIEIPRSVTSIGPNAFNGCTSLTNIKIPSSVTSIKNWAFDGCTSLTNIEIPSSVTSIGVGAFRECNNFTRISVDKNNIKYVDKDGVLYNREETKIVCYPAGKPGDNFVIPSNVIWIEKSAFDGCGGLKSITIPSSVTSIGENAFYKCSGLESIIIPSSVTSIGWYAFENCKNLNYVTIPSSVTKIGNYAFRGCSSLTIYTKADNEGHRYAEEEGVGYVLDGIATSISVKYQIKEEENWDISEKQDGSVIAKWALSNKTLIISGNGNMKDWNSEDSSDWHNVLYRNYIKNVIIEDGILNIGERAFYKCSNLESIVIPSGVTSIDVSIFEECSSLKKIKIPNSVISIGDRAFLGCRSLEEIEIPSSVKSIGYSAFYECSSLEEIEIPSSITSIVYGVFRGCSSMKSIEIPESVEYIGEVFYGCSSLTRISVDKNNTVYVDEDGVLYNKRKKEIIRYPAGKRGDNFVVPSSVENIGIYAFEGCSSLTNIEILSSVAKIGDSAFYGCSSLKEIKSPSNVTSIGKKVFSGCRSLEKIKIPSSVTKIGDSAFDGCSSLTIYTKENSEGHRYAEENKNGYIIVEKGAKVTINPNEGKLGQKEYIVRINVDKYYEMIELNEQSLKYQWTKSTEEPAKESFKESFENGQNIIKNTGDGVWYLWIYAEDELGNEIITRSEGFNFDNTPSEAEVQYSEIDPTNKDVTVKINANEKIQEVEGWKLSEDKLTLIKIYTENTAESGENIEIKDLVGNITTVNIKVLNIDKKAPEAKVQYQINSTNQEVEVTIIANEKIQEVEGWELSEDKIILTKVYTEKTPEEGENIEIKDIAGNITIVNVNTSKPIFTLNKYEIKDSYIVKINPNTTYNEFIKDILTNQTYEMKEGNKTVKGNDLIKTGQVLTTQTGKKYTLVVIGDLNGDGKISLVELARISKIGAGKIKDIKEIEKMAIDANADGKITILDLANIAKMQNK